MNVLEYRELVLKETADFDVKKAVEKINEWLDSYIKYSGLKKVVMGISGGKDSTVVAKILADKLGPKNVYGLLMPNGIQKDLGDSLRVAEILDINYEVKNIEAPFNALVEMLGASNISNDARINIAPRIRMTTLYTYGQTHGCRVAGTGNLSELTLGYFTKHGDGGHDFNIIADFTSLEVMRIGEELGLPIDLVYKTPDDGLSGMSDEEKLGITYIEMHRYLRRKGEGVSLEVIKKIEKMERMTKHKREPEPFVPYYY